MSPYRPGGPWTAAGADAWWRGEPTAAGEAGAVTVPHIRDAQNQSSDTRPDGPTPGTRTDGPTPGTRTEGHNPGTRTDGPAAAGGRGRRPHQPPGARFRGGTPAAADAGAPDRARAQDGAPDPTGPPHAGAPGRNGPQVTGHAAASTPVPPSPRAAEGTRAGRSGGRGARRAVAGTTAAPAPPRPVRREARSPAVGLALLVPLALLAAFFGWASAGPLVFVTGGGERGTATITGCVGRDIGQRCVGRFTAAGQAFVVDRVALLGVPDGQRTAGTALPARMTDRDGRLAYLGDSLALHLRWAAGLVAAVVCGAAIAWATGVPRQPDRRRRRHLWLACLLAPVALVGAFTGYLW